ncbi:MAG TPA: redoxin domain-containing protein [Candidatus Bathyarchaeia archaeon]|nr:redoxin domain-containing protein [Candidatus Bathyarchaeia archaeon]
MYAYIINEMVEFAASGAFGDIGYWFAGRRSAKLKVGTALLTLLLIAISVFSVAAVSPVAQAAGSEAPPFTLTSIDGTNFSLSDYSGKVVVLDLMATWCPVCKDEMKELSQLGQEYSDVVIITISVYPLETADDLRTYKEEHNTDWLFARDTDNVLVKYGAFTLPTIVIIDPQGYISFQKAALVPAKELASEVEKAYSGGIEEPAGPEEPEGQFPTVMGLYVGALFLGLASFFAPCAFPLLPGYISYYLGRYEGGPTLSGSVKAGIAAATGINGMFALIGIAVAVGATAVRSYLEYLKPGVGVFIVLLGLAMVLGKTEIFDRFGGKLSSYSSKLGGRARYSGLFFYGVGYGLASMGCQAPVFIALIFAGLATGGVLEAFMVFLSFSIGMGGMMITVSVIVGTAKMKLLERMRALTPYINRACGVILIIVGAYFLLEFV